MEVGALNEVTDGSLEKGNSLKADLTRLTLIQDEDSQRAISQSIAKNLGKKGIDTLMSITTKGANPWSIAMVVSQSNLKHDVEGVSKLLCLPPVIDNSDRSAKSVFLSILKDQLPRQTIENPTVINEALHDALRVTLQKKKQEVATGDYHTANVLNHDLFDIARCLVSADHSQTAYLAKLITDQKPSLGVSLASYLTDLRERVEAGEEVDMQEEADVEEFDVEEDAVVEEGATGKWAHQWLQNMTRVVVHEVDGHEFQRAEQTVEQNAYKIPLPVEREAWKTQTKRLIRRAAIARVLQTTSTLEEIKNYVRQSERDMNVNELVESLTTDEFVVDPKMAGVAEDVWERTCDKFPQVKAIVLIGSSVHGGAMIRKATRHSKDPDFDWSVIGSEALTEEEVIQLTEDINQQLPTIAKQHQLGKSFHSCELFNPSNDHGQEIETTHAASELLTDPFLDPYDLLIYFSPSFPKEVNETNKKHLLTALRDLYTVDKAKWEEVVAGLLEAWKDTHELKAKHFASTLSKKDAQLRKNVARMSRTHMLSPMQDLLEKTGQVNEKILSFSDGEEDAAK